MGKQVIFACLFAVVAFQMTEARRGSKGKGRGKGGKGGRGDKMSEMCENAEEGSDAAFKCNCFAVMKVKRDDRSEEQKATAKACMEKRKEKMQDKKENKENNSESSEDKKQSWKSKVKACRQARKAIKGGHATDDEKAFAEENQDEGWQEATKQ